ncbi:MAG: UDP-2-acetamido-2-deoxy-ribo-hexuluronate aminotransferase [Bacteroidia bacterium]|jgi:UDP-2-acetamido-2-deoxy-ribo-hexuluronate aminotransferase
MSIQMVDLKGQYLKIKDEINEAIQSVIDSTSFINGPKVQAFARNLELYLGVKHVIPCANGTDALQVALMALELTPGDEVIVPCFTYVATAEVIALLGLTPVLVDVYPDTFQIDVDAFEASITSKTKAVVPVHLFGQCADMASILKIAKKHNIYVVEDTAQAIGASYTLDDKQTFAAGSMGDFGTTSFFPSKNLGCYGDGGAIYTNDDALAAKAKMICNHGQKVKYHHSVVGVNSRLDTIQAAILDVKLKYLDEFSASRQSVASKYDAAFKDHPAIEIPVRDPKSSHVFHQYTLKIKGLDRDALKQFLADNDIPSMVYYPIPLNKQEAYKGVGNFPVTDDLCTRVLSLPMSTELTDGQINTIINTILKFT